MVYLCLKEVTSLTIQQINGECMIILPGHSLSQVARQKKTINFKKKMHFCIQV